MAYAIIFYVIILCTELSRNVFAKTDRIIGGSNADITDFPYMVSFRNVKTDYHFCGGVIISSTHILSAAHCFSDKMIYFDKIVMYTGSTDPSPKSGQANYIQQVHIHPAFGDRPFSNHDIAIVKVKSPIKFNKYQRKVNLPLRNIRDGEDAIVVGWGTRVHPSLEFSKVLQKASMKVMSIENCQRRFKEPLKKQQFCAYQCYGVGICNGDSGGPLIVKGKVAGIISGNSPCAMGVPDIYMNVFDYLGYIKYVTGL